MFSIPDEKGRIIQPNDGKHNGNIFASFGIDLNDGKIQLSEQSKTVLDKQTTASFEGYAAAIMPYSTNGSTGSLIALSDRAYVTNFNEPTGTWTISTSGTDPDGGNTVSDMEYFNSLLIASGSTSSGTNDLLAWDGSTWISYWKTTLGQTGFPSGFRTLIKRGSDGNLYFTVGGNKLYKIDPESGATITGNGTLDFSAEPYQFTCLARTSTRLFIGTKNLSGGNAAIIEWDMSPSSSTANHIHDVGTSAVLCIGVHDNVPYAVLNDGTIKYFDNVSFKEYEGFRFPVKKNQKLSEDFIHPNGWDIIDDNLHFLVTGRTNTQPLPDSETESYWAMPAGVWCLDPDIGLYHRFTIGNNTSSQFDYGKGVVTYVGALRAIKENNSNTTKFLASYEYRLSDGVTLNTVLIYHDQANSLMSRGHIITPFALSFREVFKTVELFHKPLQTGCKIRVYTRGEDTDSVPLSGVWSSATSFNTENINTGIVKGDMMFIKAGGGAGQWVKIESVSESETVTTITIEEPNTFVSLNDYGLVECFDFKFMGSIEDVTRDYHNPAVPQSDTKRKRQFLFEFIQAATKEIEVDYIMVNT